MEHNPWSNHTFKCTKISKKRAHNIIRDSWAESLQPALATAGYIRQTNNIDIEQKYIKMHDISAQPFDISFDPDPTTIQNIHTHCPYSTIGADITISNNACLPPSFNSLDDVISSASALADSHLQKSEKRKLYCINKKDTNNPARIIKGDTVIGDILQLNMILLPFAIDPHG
jgi:hypothetical protein